MPSPAASPARRPVRVVGDLAIEALVLPDTLRTPQEVFAQLAPGELCYVPRWNHFALRVGPCVLHANLGRVYRAPPGRRGASRPPGGARAAPERVKECRRLKCPGAPACRYYHDPELHPDAADVRNFMADSWLYAPAAAPAPYGARRFGSADSLEADLRAVGVGEARRFLHQTAHDLLCALLLWRHVLGPASELRSDTGAGRGPPQPKGA